MSTSISISVMCSVGEPDLRYLSLVLPLIALARRKNRCCHLQRSVMGLTCSLALLGGFSSTRSAYMHQDFSALLDTSLLFGSAQSYQFLAAANAGVCALQMKRSVKQHRNINLP